MTGFYTPGSYVVEVRAWADNEQDTGYFEDLTITVVDPCLTAALSIDVDDSIFKSSPAVTLTQFVQYDALSISWSDAIIVPQIADVDLCGPLTHEITDSLGAPPDPLVFQTVNMATATKTLSVQTSDFSKVGQH